MRQQTIDWAVRKLGPDAVLLPVPDRQKGCKIKGWSKLTAACMSDPKHSAKLLAHGNLGVGLGEQSGGLCSIDIDLDEEVDGFLRRNPKLAVTLRTIGARGCNLWVRILGPYPRAAKLTRTDGSPWGEWRATGNQTIIAGTHPTGVHYRVHALDAPVVELRFEKIVWPVGVGSLGFPGGGERESSSPSFPLPSSYSPLPALLCSTSYITTFYTKFLWFSGRSLPGGHSVSSLRRREGAPGGVAAERRHRDARPATGPCNGYGDGGRLADGVL